MTAPKMRTAAEYAAKAETAVAGGRGVFARDAVCTGEHADAYRAEALVWAALAGAAATLEAAARPHVHVPSQRIGTEAGR